MADRAARADKSLEATVLPGQVGEFVCRRIGPAHRIDRAAHAIVEPQHAAGTAAGIDGDVANGAAAMIGMRIQIVGRHVASIWKIPLRSIMCAHFSWQRNFLFRPRSEEHTSELQSLMRISYAVFCLKKNKLTYYKHNKSLN